MSEGVSERNGTRAQFLSTSNETWVETLPGANWNLVALRPPLGGVVAELRLRPGTLPMLPNEVWSAIGRRAGPTFIVDHIFGPIDLQFIVHDLAESVVASAQDRPALSQSLKRLMMQTNITMLANLLNLDISMSTGQQPDRGIYSVHRPLEGPPRELLKIMNNIDTNLDGVSIEISGARHLLVSPPRSADHEKII